MAETHNQKKKEHSQELLLHRWLYIIFMQLLKGYDTINISINARKKVPNWNSLAKIPQWSISSNFWQIILTEYFVQIYGYIWAVKGMNTSIWIFSQSHCIPKHNYISLLGEFVLWLISYACQGPEGTSRSYSPAQHPPGPSPSLTTAQEPISSSLETPVHDPAWLWTSLNVTPTHRPMPQPSLSPSLYPGKCLMPGTGAACLPGLTARPCPAIPEDFAPLWSCQPVRCHDNSNAKTKLSFWTKDFFEWF